MVVRHVGIAKASSNVPTMVLGKVKITAKTHSVIKAKNLHKILTNICRKLHATKRCHKPLCLRQSQCLATLITEMLTKVILAARTEAAAEADKPTYSVILAYNYASALALSKSEYLKCESGNPC